MTISDLRREHIQAAIDAFRRLGPAGFHTHYDWGQPVRFYLRFEGQDYPAKAIVGAAHEIAFGEKPRNLSGGEQTNGRLRSLGFEVIDRTENPARATSEPHDPAPILWWVNQGRTYLQELDGGYLWAPQRAKDGGPRPYWTTMTEVSAGAIVAELDPKGQLQRCRRLALAQALLRSARRSLRASNLRGL